ncbi:putative Thioredoxin-like_fold domain-containing protein [Alphaproteobacteria bacterium]
MNRKAITSYLLIILFVVFLIFAYSKYTNKTMQHEKDELKQSILDAVKLELDTGKSPETALTGSTNLTTAQVETIVKDIIKNNPELLIESVNKFATAKAYADKAKAAYKIGALRDKLENDTNDPVLGDPNATIKIVEFFDYCCSACKMMDSVKRQILDKNPDVKFILKPMPILGESSVLPIKFALAINKLDKTKFSAFEELNYACEQKQDGLFELAEKAGVDVAKLKQIFSDKNNDAQLNQVIQNNLKLAQDLEVHGTPTCILGDQLLVGALSYEALQQAVDAARKQPAPQATAQPSSTDTTATTTDSSSSK